MRIPVACMVLICVLTSCTKETPMPTPMNTVVRFMPKTHESMLLVNYKIEIDGVEQPALFKRGTSPDQTIRSKGKPIVQENGATRVVVFTRSASQAEWTKLTTLQIVPSGGSEIVLHESMKVICDEE